MNGSTKQEEESDDDVTETSFRNSEGEGSTREAGAKKLNGSMNEPDTVRTVRAGHMYLCTVQMKGLFSTSMYVRKNYNTYEIIWICDSYPQSAERYVYRSDIPRSSPE